MLINNVDLEPNCENTPAHCNQNIHEIMTKMGAKKSRTFQGKLFDKFNSYLFCWDDIPENEMQCNNIKKHISNRYSLDWVLKAKIEKKNLSEIVVYTQTKKLYLRRQVNYVKLCYYPNDVDDKNCENLKDDTFFIKYEGDDINVYFREYTILEGQDCVEYLQVYAPLHLPQIQYALKNILKSEVLGDCKNINILDIGSGPATVPLAFCRLEDDIIKNRTINITTIEASKTFNDMIKKFDAYNTNKSINIVRTLEGDIIDFMNESEFDRDYNWIIIANSITAIGIDKSMSDVTKTLDKFISNILKSNKKLHYNSKILLTFIEGSKEYSFKFSDYLDKIENVVFNNLKIKRTITPPENGIYIDSEWICDCEFYKTKIGLCKPFINSKSLRLELKE